MSNKVKFKYANGDILRDIVSGYTGVVMVQAYYSTGCKHYGIQSQELNSTGEPRDWHWLDESRVELIQEKEVFFRWKKGSSSGPMPSGPNM